MKNYIEGSIVEFTYHCENEFELRAAKFAAQAHRSQRRKYTNEPYIVHPAEVAEIVRSVPHSPAQLAAAWLHDVIEDCGITEDEISHEFNIYVTSLVKWLTDVSKPEQGNRAVRKAIDRGHTALSPPEAKTIKLADLISNSRSIVQYDPGFAKVYLEEKRLLLEVLREGDSELYRQASEYVGSTP